jgi:HEAT repeat protein
MVSTLVARTGLSACLCALVAALLLLSACGSKLPGLREQLKDPDPDKRAAAIQALGEARDTVSVPKIVELLLDSVPVVRKAAAIWLGKMGDRRAAQPLADFYDKEQSKDLQSAALQSLIHLSSYSIDPLIGLLSSIRPAVRSGAAQALGKLRARRALDPLIALLRDRDVGVRKDAIYALRQIGDDRGLDAIAAMVQDTNPDIEGAAERALSGEGYQEQLNRAKRAARRIPFQ